MYMLINHLIQSIQLSLYDSDIGSTVVQTIFRYQLYIEGKGKLNGECTPLCQDVLKHHLKRVNYQSVNWKRSPEQNSMTTNPVGLG